MVEQQRATDTDIAITGNGQLPSDGMDARNRAIVEHGPLAFAEIDRDWVIRYVSSAAVSSGSRSIGTITPQRR